VGYERRQLGKLDNYRNDRVTGGVVAAEFVPAAVPDIPELTLAATSVKRNSTTVRRGPARTHATPRV
jgi:hypothetical protein